MSRPYYNRAHSNIQDWIDGQYEYIPPDPVLDTKPKTDPRDNPYIPKDVARDHTPEDSDETSSRDKRHRSHRTTRDHHKPLTPPAEDQLERERGRHERRHRSDRSTRSYSHGSRGDHDVDREERRLRHDRDTKYPPKADRGRPRRPGLERGVTAPYSAPKSGREKTPEPPRHRTGRRYSSSSSPPRRRGDDDKSSSSRTHRRPESPPPPPRSSTKKDDRDRDRDKDARSHHGSGASTSTTKPRRPSLSHSQTYSGNPTGPAHATAGRSFSFLHDPRLVSAAEAALQAGATVAVGLAGTRGDWGGNKGAKVARAALGAGVLNALRNPKASPEPAAAAPAPAPTPTPASASPLEPAPRPGHVAGEVVGKYAADHIGSGRKHGSTRRRHH